MALPSPLSAIQLLWVNLVTDSLPAIALGMEKTHDSVMERKPTPKNQSLFSEGLGFKILAEGVLVGALSLCAFLLGLKSGDERSASTMCFGVLSFSQLFHAFNMRSEKPIFKRKIPRNPILWLSAGICMALQAGIMIFPKTAEIFGVVPLNLHQWITVAVLSFAPIPLCEIFKMIKRK
jgi:Ca2+-transporting ATPase